MSGAPFYPRAFGALSVYAEALAEGGHLSDWSPARPLMEGTFAEERDPALTVLERQAQAEPTGLDLETELMQVLPAYVRVRTGPPEEHVMAAALAVALDQMVHDAPDVARALLERCSAVVATAAGGKS